jgi:hypothetical protein
VILGAENREVETASTKQRRAAQKNVKKAQAGAKKK